VHLYMDKARQIGMRLEQERQSLKSGHRVSQFMNGEGMSRTIDMTPGERELVQREIASYFDKSSKPPRINAVGISKRPSLMEQLQDYKPTDVNKHPTKPPSPQLAKSDLLNPAHVEKRLVELGYYAKKAPVVPATTGLVEKPKKPESKGTPEKTEAAIPAKDDKTVREGIAKLFEHGFSDGALRELAVASVAGPARQDPPDAAERIAANIIKSRGYLGAA
jgi:hypothetical protein